MMEVIGEDIKACGVNKKMVMKKKDNDGRILAPNKDEDKKIIIVYDDVFQVISIS